MEIILHPLISPLQNQQPFLSPLQNGQTLMCKYSTPIYYEISNPLWLNFLFTKEVIPYMKTFETKK